MPAQAVIIDTDFSADVGDVGGIAHALELHNTGVLDIKAIGVCTSNTKAPGAVDVLCTHYGLTIPIGTWKGAAFDPSGSTWAAHLYDTYSHPNTGLASTVDNAVTVYRTALAAAADASVVFVAIGPLNQVEDLLVSPGDGIDARNGLDLVTAKCSALYIMGGQFVASYGTGVAFLTSMSNGPEWNFQQAPADASYVATNWPTAIYVNPFELAGSGAGGATVIEEGSTVSTALPADSPIRTVYEFTGFNTNGRTAWDSLTFDMMANPTDYYFAPGSLTVDSATGNSTFAQATAGVDQLAVRRLSVTDYETRLEAALVAHTLPAAITRSRSHARRTRTRYR